MRKPKGQWAKENRSYFKLWRADHKRLDTKSYIISYIVDARKVHAKKRNLPFTITKDYVGALPSEMCPVFKIPLEWGTGSDHTASLDRIVPKLGYVEGNVCWMSKRANILKRDATREEVKLLHDWFKQIP